MMTNCRGRVSRDGKVGNVDNAPLWEARVIWYHARVVIVEDIVFLQQVVDENFRRILGISIIRS